jgi:aspartate aminotransferase-like enzyme
MEAAVSNFFSAGDEVIVASCGKFGERWIELAKVYGLKSHVLQYPYGYPVRPDDIEKMLEQNGKIRGVFLQACESSTAIQNDLESIAAIIARSDALSVVDAVTGLGTMDLKVGLDVVVSGSQKALMIPPGLGLIGISQKAGERLNLATLPRYYFDLRAARKAWEKEGQTPFTPATSLILTLRKSLEAIETFGLSKLIRVTENRARATRAGLATLALKVFAKRPANAMTAVEVAPGQTEAITSRLKQDFGIQVAGGQGELKGKIFRISHMGYIDHIDTLGVLSALELILKSLGQPVVLGRSLEEFQKVYKELFEQ